LYGQACDVFTDHDALKALLNVPHPSGKLARWGLALQEVNLTIHYHPGIKNANADALSRYPQPESVDQESAEDTAVIASLSPVTLSKSREQGDPELSIIIAYLEKKQLPEDTKRARELTLSKPQYHIRDGTLFYVAKGQDSSDNSSCQRPTSYL
jgi:hypothetical protein